MNGMSKKYKIKKCIDGRWLVYQSARETVLLITSCCVAYHPVSHITPGTYPWYFMYTQTPKKEKWQEGKERTKKKKKRFTTWYNKFYFQVFDTPPCGEARPFLLIFCLGSIFIFIFRLVFFVFFCSSFFIVFFCFRFFFSSFFFCYIVFWSYFSRLGCVVVFSYPVPDTWLAWHSNLRISFIFGLPLSPVCDHRISISLG